MNNKNLSELPFSNKNLNLIEQLKTKEQLIREAEEKVVKSVSNSDTLTEPLSTKQIKEIIHNLSVHQIELELQNTELKRIYSSLEEAKLRYFDLYDSAPVGYLIVAQNGSIKEANLTAAKLLGTSKTILLKTNITRFIHTNDQDLYYLHHRELDKTMMPQQVELRIKKNNNDFVWMLLKLSISQHDDYGIYRIILSDINAQKEATLAVEESEKKFKSLFSTIGQGLALFEARKSIPSNKTDYFFIDVNASYEKMFNINKKMIIGKSVTEVFQFDKGCVSDAIEEVALSMTPSYYVSYFEAYNKHFSFYIYIPEKNQIAMLVSDITDRVKRENDITYLNYHDQLTGTYNRRFYEEELARLDHPRNYPLSIIMGDINGLKLVNDSFGHEMGDQLIIAASTAIKSGCRADDIIARIGGDEFIVILPKADESIAEDCIARIQGYARQKIIDAFELSISFGYCTKHNETVNIKDIFKDAENQMYQKKLLETSNNKHKMIDIIMKALYEKNNRELIHATRVSRICEITARSLKLSKIKIKQVKTSGLLHDIGNIAIADKILNSTQKLAHDEWVQIKRHPEISYRILSSSPEMSEVASVVLEHHERWDGNGYPRGKSGEDISLAARIIAIADAYDAMTRENPYKKKFTKKEAVDEIKQYSGKQFDPKIVPVFVDLIEKKLI